MDHGQLLVLSGPSGVGKSTLIHRFLAEVPESTFSISVTTRAPRGAERNGVDYHFISVSEFQKLRSQRMLVEWAKVHDNFYGTLKTDLDRELAKAKTVLMELDYQGYAKIVAHYRTRTVSVFLLPPSWAELERRLAGRRTENREDFAKRLKNAWDEIRDGSGHYNYILLNDHLEGTLAHIKFISQFERASQNGYIEPALLAQAKRLKKESSAASWLRGNRPPG